MGNSARLGQHFLAEGEYTDAIVSAATPEPGKKVLEIGPGRGVLTRPLLEAGAAVTAVELDDRLYASLVEKLVPLGLKLIHADFLDLDLARLNEGPYRVVANLPYAVGTPILQRLLPWSGWSDAILMFQKEVALRLCAAPGGPDYGLLTLSTLLWAEPAYLMDVPPKAFRPPPKVDSGVVMLRRREAPLIPAERQDAFFKMVKPVFAQRRKKAAKSLAASLGKPRNQIESALASHGVRVDARPEDIPFDVYVSLLDA